MIGRIATLAAALLAPLTSLALADDARLPVDPATGRIVVQRVVPVEGVAADELLSRARAWVASSYRSPEVVQLDDRSAARIVVRSYATVRYGIGSVHLWYDLTIEARDGRARATVGALEIRSAAETGGMAAEDWLARVRRGVMEPRIAAALTSVLDSLAASLSSSSPVPGGDQW